jgi:membrane-bound serine protease (ClpP class)
MRSLFSSFMRGFNLRRLPLLLLLCAALAVVARAEQPVVVKMVLNDTIQPVTEDELNSAIQLADSTHAAALLVELNTPGGLLDTTRTMAGAILDSRVPIIVYVSPNGARAGSAGFFLMEAADIAAMAPGTNAGAAHPVLEVGQMDETMAHKVTNDAQAFLRSYVTRRNRNPEAAAAAIESSHSYTAEEALHLHLIDLTAANDWDLLHLLDGREVVRMNGQHQILHLAGARFELARPSIRNQVLSWIVNPNLALMLLLGGALLIYLEFNTPGTVVPGALGTVMVLLAIFALNLLPIRFTAVLLLLAAFALMALEAKFGGHGVLASAGILCLTFGTLTLVAAPIPEMSVSPWVAFGVSTAFGGITVFLVRIAIRARRRKALLGADALVGHAAVAMEPLAPEGHVLVEGEIWRAVAADPVPKGAALHVVGRSERLLHVVADHELDAPQP